MVDHSEAPALRVPDPWFLGGVINSSLSSASPYLILLTPFGFKQSQGHLPADTKEKVQPQSPSSSSPSIPRGSCGALAVLVELCRSPPLPARGISGLCAGPALPAQPGAKANTEQHVPWAAQQLCLAGLCCSLTWGLCHASPAQGTGDPGWVHSSNGTPCEQHSSHGSQPNITQQHTEPPEKPHQQVKDKPLAFSGLKLSHWSFFFPYVWDNVNIWTPVLFFPLSPHLHFKVKTTIKGFSKYDKFCMVPGGSKTGFVAVTCESVEGEEGSPWTAEQCCNRFRLCTPRGCMCPAKIYCKNMLFSVTD